MYGRLAALPDEASLLQRRQMLAALCLGTEIIQLRRIGSPLNLGSDLHAALDAIARGDTAIATARLGRLDEELAARLGTAALRACGTILAITEMLERHAPISASMPGLPTVVEGATTLRCFDRSLPHRQR